MRKNLFFSGHAITRMAQRSLSADEIEYIICHGQRYHAAGVIHFFLGKKNIPETDQKADKFRRLEGATVLLDSQESRAVITSTAINLPGRKFGARPNITLRSVASIICP